MTDPGGVLHLFCGKICAGKSTLATTLAAADGTILISEDEWLDALFGPEMSSVEFYANRSARLRAIMGPHVTALLKAGLSVVLDYPANTAKTRVWMRGILDASGAADRLHVLDPPDDVCLARLRLRNASGDHPFAVTEEQFHEISRHSATPSPEEGFAIVMHGRAD